jgi:hypothetical protein
MTGAPLPAGVYGSDGNTSMARARTILPNNPESSAEPNTLRKFKQAPRSRRKISAPTEFHRQMPLNEVPVDVVLAQHPAAPPRKYGEEGRAPQHSAPWYFMKCSLCDRGFTSSHGIYCHLSQSDAEHLNLFGKEKSFDQAVQVCGTLVTNCTDAEVQEHNRVAEEMMMGKSSTGKPSKFAI